MSARRQRGVALLTVLLMVAVISVLVIAVLDDIRFGLRRSSNAEALGMARWQAVSAEALAIARLGQLHRASPQRTTLEGDWAGREFALPLTDGLARARLDDATHCFNLNSVVQGGSDLIMRRESAVAQFIALARSLDIPAGQAEALADSLVDWLDSDQQPSPRGHEDASYRRGRGGYLTGQTLLADVSELRAIHGFDANIYQRLRPWVCTLPTNAPSPLNVNTLRPAQARLLQAWSLGALDEARARSLLAARPAAGWASAQAFWTQPEISALALDAEALAQLAVRTRYFRLRAQVQSGPAQVVLDSLFDQQSDGHARLVARQWNTPE
ncbi:type II secretion system minor pseudopilin GspK [Luteimonas sp. e5]